MQLIVEAQRALQGCDGMATGPIGTDVAALLPAIAECMRGDPEGAVAGAVAVAVRVCRLSSLSSLSSLLTLCCVTHPPLARGTRPDPLFSIMHGVFGLAAVVLHSAPAFVDGLLTPSSVLRAQHAAETMSSLDPALLRSVLWSIVLFRFTDSTRWRNEYVTAARSIARSCPHLVNASSTGP